MRPDEPPPWTLSQLADRVSADLDNMELDQRSGRVSDHPDPRTVRYYTTLGLVDRPLGVRDRMKLYGERHRQQLVAIKRLQANGWSLSDIQSRLVGVSSRELADLSRAAMEADPPSAPATREGFWQVRPRRALPVPALPPGTPPLAKPTVRMALELGGLTVTFPSRRAATDVDLEAIAVAAAPLLQLLRDRQLLQEDS